MAEKETCKSLPLSSNMTSRGEHLRAEEGPTTGRLFMTIIKAVVVLNSLLILIIHVSAQWGAWDVTDAQTAKHPGLQYDALQVRPSFPLLRGGPHRVKHWVKMTKRQTPPAGNASTLPVQTFSVDVPLLGPGGKVVGAGTPDGFQDIETSVGSAAAGCQVTLAVTVFANSFGQPFVGNYTPPDCIGDSNTVVMNLTVQSKGRQFDRLGIM